MTQGMYAFTPVLALAFIAWTQGFIIKDDCDV